MTGMLACPCDTEASGEEVRHKEAPELCQKRSFSSGRAHGPWWALFSERTYFCDLVHGFLYPLLPGPSESFLSSLLICGNAISDA